MKKDHIYDSHALELLADVRKKLHPLYIQNQDRKQREKYDKNILTILNYFEYKKTENN